MPPVCFPLLVERLRLRTPWHPYCYACFLTMSTALELVYEYRHLMGKCRVGAGLSMDEIEAVEAIEGLFAVGATPFEQRAGGLSATLRGGPNKLWDKVQLASAELDRIAVRVTALLEPGSPVELLVEDEELRLSYRFRTRIASVQGDPAGGYKVVLELVGLPLLVRRGPKQARPNAKNLPPRPSSEPRVVAA